MLLPQILLKFNTGYYEEGFIITQREKIIKRYLKTDFLFDLICICITFVSDEYDFFRLIMLGKINHLFELINILNE